MSEDSPHSEMTSEEMEGESLAIDGLLRELARGGEDDDETFVGRVLDSIGAPSAPEKTPPPLKERMIPGRRTRRPSVRSWIVPLAAAACLVLAFHLINIITTPKPRDAFAALLKASEHISSIQEIEKLKPLVERAIADEIAQPSLDAKRVMDLEFIESITGNPKKNRQADDIRFILDNLKKKRERVALNFGIGKVHAAEPLAAARAYIKELDYDDAFAALEGDGSEDAALFRGWCWKQQKKYAKARSEFARCSGDLKDFFTARTYECEQNFAKAATIYEKLGERLNRAYFYAGYAWKYGAGNDTKARTAFEKLENYALQDYAWVRVSMEVPKEWLVNDFTWKDMKELPLPAKSKHFKDPVTNMLITRITDPVIDGYRREKDNKASCGPAYRNIENATGSRLVVGISGRMCLYDTNDLSYIKTIKQRATGLPQYTDFTWDKHDPDMGYFTGWSSWSGKFIAYDCKTDKTTVLLDIKKDLPWARKLSILGDCSADGRWWAFSAWAKTSIALVSYEKDAEGKNKGRIRGIREDSDLLKNTERWKTSKISVSPSGKRIVIPSRGMAFDHSLKQQYELPKLDYQDSFDFVIDDNGREVLFNGRRVIDIETGKDTKYPSTEAPYRPWNFKKRSDGKKNIVVGRIDVCGNSYAAPGWAVVSTLAGSHVTYYPQQCIMLVEVTQRKEPAPRVWRLAYHRMKFNFGPGPCAKISFSGKYIYFNSNWDVKDGEENIYRITMPEQWYEKLMGAEKAKALRAKAAKLTGLEIK